MPSKLTEADKELIRDLCHDKTDKELATMLGVSDRTIERERKRQGISKKDGRVELDVHQDDLSDAPRPVLTSAATSEAEMKEYWKRRLEESARGKHLRTLFEADKWGLVISEWVGFHMQLEDMTHAEENVLEQMIMVKLRIYENQENKKQLTLEKKHILEELGCSETAAESGVIAEAMQDGDMEKAMLAQSLIQVISTLADINSDLKDLIDRYGKMAKDMNATREQREKQQKIGGDTFFSKITEFNKASKRQKEGRQAELLRIAADRSNNNLRQAVEFADGEIDAMLWDAETVAKIERQELEIVQREVEEDKDDQDDT